MGSENILWFNYFWYSFNGVKIGVNGIIEINMIDVDGIFLFAVAVNRQKDSRSATPVKSGWSLSGLMGGKPSPKGISESLLPCFAGSFVEKLSIFFFNF